MSSFNKIEQRELILISLDTYSLRDPFNISLMCPSQSNRKCRKKTPKTPNTSQPTPSSIEKPRSSDLMEQLRVLDSLVCNGMICFSFVGRKREVKWCTKQNRTISENPSYENNLSEVLHVD